MTKTRGEIVSTDEIVAFWKAENGCEVKQDKIDLPNKVDDGTTVSVTKYSDCKEEGALVLYTLNGGGHTWPGGKQYLRERWIGKTNRDIVACDVIWDFFKSLSDNE